MAAIKRLNHAVLYVTDAAEAARFYSGALGFEEVARLGDGAAIFLKLNDSGNDHDLGLFSVGADAPPRVPGSPGLYHLAWQVDTIDDLVEVRRVLVDHGALVGESSHGNTKSLYGRDPSGNEFEVMWMLPRAQWQAFEGRAIVEPLDLGAETAKWSGTGTAAEMGSPTPG